MTTSFIKKWAWAMGMILCCGVLFSQEKPVIYWEPQVSINYKVTPTYTHNFSVVNRNYLYESDLARFRIRHLEFVHFSNLKVQDNQSLAIGIMYRFRDNFEPGNSNELRLTQQYNLTHSVYGIRLGHRFRSEQRIRKSSSTQRFRYRFALDFPLQGERLDVGESYLVGSTESVLSVGKAIKPIYDQRVSLAVGWLLQKQMTFQTGIEYRVEDYVPEGNNVLFFNSSLTFSL